MLLLLLLLLLCILSPPPNLLLSFLFHPKVAFKGLMCTVFQRAPQRGREKKITHKFMSVVQSSSGGFCLQEKNESNSI